MHLEALFLRPLLKGRPTVTELNLFFLHSDA